MNQPTTDVLLAMVDTVREILASIESTGAEGDVVVDDVIAQIREVLADAHWW
jgi:two-component system chemotaxis sensor kinase CheA